MSIKKETASIPGNEDGVKALDPVPGDSVEVQLRDGTYRTGQVLEMSDNAITVSNNDGDHICNVNDITDIKKCASEQLPLNKQYRAAMYVRAATEESLCTQTTWYFPLEIRMLTDDMRDEVFDMDDFDFVNSREAVWYMDDILGQIEKDNSYFDTPRMLAEYIDDVELNNKVYSMIPTVEEHSGRLWGAMVMQLSGTLAPEDTSRLKDYILGQNSDGYGEGLEQHEIRVSDGELYVSFWNTGKDYAIYTQEEFAALPVHGQVSTHEQRKPKCPIIGADGNVFNIMGIAARTLKENSMADAAEVMRSRVMESGSHNEALAIIMEYVEPTDAGGHRNGGMVMQL